MRGTAGMRGGLAVSIETRPDQVLIPTLRTHPKLSGPFHTALESAAPGVGGECPAELCRGGGVGVWWRPPPWTARTALPHDQDVATPVLDGQEDLGDHDEDPALGGRREVPHALGIGRVVAGVVGGLDVARVVAKLAAAVLVCGHHGPCPGQARLALSSLGGPGQGW